MGVCSQPLEGTDNASATPPNPTPRKVYRKKYSRRYQKAHDNLFSYYFIRSPKPKRTRIERPSSALFTSIKFPPPNHPQKIKISKGSGILEKESIPPLGNQIFNLEILSNAISIFSCTVPICIGKAKLYQHILKDDLKDSLLSSAIDVKCKFQNSRQHFQ